jgi:transcriptional regulator with XRE-family HTH domain
MLTNGKQIAAARQLLGWSQANLAERSGVSKPSIIRIEKDLHGVKHDSREAIQSAFEKNNIEFIEGNGVRENKQTLRVLKGQKGFQEFYDDLYETARDIGGDICLFNGVGMLVSKWLGEAFLKSHIARMLEIKDNFKYKIIFKEGDGDLLAPEYCEYRWFPKELFSEKSIFIYGSKVGFLTHDEKNIEVLVLNQSELAEAQFILFNLAWNYQSMKVNSNE